MSDTTTGTEKVRALVMGAAEAGAIASHSQSGTIRFGTKDIRDLSGGIGPFRVYRVSSHYPKGRWCGHMHCSHRNALKCARSTEIAGGWSFGETDLHVEVHGMGCIEE